MACLKAAVVTTLDAYTSRPFVDRNLFQIGCFVVARFLLTSASCGPSAIAELLVSTLFLCPLQHVYTTAYHVHNGIPSLSSMLGIPGLVRVICRLRYGCCGLCVL